MIRKLGNWAFGVVAALWLNLLFFAGCYKSAWRRPSITKLATAALLLVCSLPAFGQGVLMQLPPVTDSMGHPIAGATVSVFTASGTLPNLTCGTPVTVYKDVGLTTPFTTLVTDGFGNFPFFIQPNSNPYGYTVSAAGTNTSICYGFSSQIGPTTSPTYSTVTFSAAGKFTETTAPSCLAGFDFIWGDSSDHRAKTCGNGGTASDLATLADFASPPAIGNTTPAAGTFTAVTATNINGALGSTTPATVTGTIIQANTGFRQNGGASGNVLRGNGTNFVSAQLAAADLANGTTGSGAVVLATSPIVTSPTFATGVSQGSGHKHQRVAGCSTGAAANSNCSSTLTWTTQFADTSYTVSCSAIVSAGIGYTQLSGKSATAITISLITTQAVIATASEFDCIADHD